MTKTGQSHQAAEGWIERLGRGLGKPPPPVEYVAMQPDGVVESASGLHTLVQALVDAFDLEDEDVVVWKLEDGRGPRAVCVLSPDGRGKTAARWL